MPLAARLAAQRYGAHAVLVVGLEVGAVAVSVAVGVRATQLSVRVATAAYALDLKRGVALSRLRVLELDGVRVRRYVSQRGEIELCFFWKIKCRKLLFQYI